MMSLLFLSVYVITHLFIGAVQDFFIHECPDCRDMADCNQFLFNFYTGSD